MEAILYVKSVCKKEHHVTSHQRTRQQTSKYWCSGALVLWCSLLLLIPDHTYGDSPADLIEAGNALYKQGRYDEALEKYLEAQKILPASPIIHFNIGAVMYKTKGYSKANEYFGTALSVNDSDIKRNVYYNLGNVRFMIKDIEGAVNFFKDALRINCNDMDAKYNLEIALKYLPSVKGEEKIGVTSGETPARGGDRSAREVTRLSETDIEEGQSDAVSKDDEPGTKGGGLDTRRGGSYTIEEIDKGRAEKILDRLKKEELRTLRDVRRAKIPEMSEMEKNW